MKILKFLCKISFINENRSRKYKKFVHGRFFYIIQVSFQLQTTAFALQLDNFMKQSVLNKGLVSGCDAANLLLKISAGASSGCGFSLSNPREGRLLPSERTANGGINLVFLFVEEIYLYYISISYPNNAAF